MCVCVRARALAHACVRACMHEKKNAKHAGKCRRGTSAKLSTRKICMSTQALSTGGVGVRHLKGTDVNVDVRRREDEGLDALKEHQLPAAKRHVPPQRALFKEEPSTFHVRICQHTSAYVRLQRVLLGFLQHRASRST